MFLALLLLVSNLGLAFNVHYCGDEIASASFVYNTSEICAKPVEPAEKACCAEAAKDHKSCCKDETVKLQDESDTIVIKTMALDIVVPAMPIEWKPVVAILQDQPVFKSLFTYYCDAHSPPLFKLYSQYIFYA
ncbi:MAG TPA: hypothetical protein VF581_03515 [Flavobacterium sp.]